MRNISIILNVVLIIAVAVLYYLHFKGGDNSKPAEEIQGPRIMPVSGSGIVFVNSDSLLDEYDFYKNKRAEFVAYQNKIKAELKTQSDHLQQEVETYQKQAIGMTDLQRSQKEEQLTAKQQQLMERKDELLGKLDEEQNKSSEELYAKLNDYLKKHNKSNNYNFVLGFQKGGGILFANDSLNITKEVVKGLNLEYNGAK